MKLGMEELFLCRPSAMMVVLMHVHLCLIILHTAMNATLKANNLGVLENLAA